MNSKNKTILLTGATGYLGGYLSKHFLSRDYNIVALAQSKTKKYKYENNPNAKVYYLDEIQIEDIFNKENIDIVIHTATIYGRKQEQITLMEKVNVEFPLLVLTEAIKHNVKVFVNTSTILAKNLNPYALTKSHFEDWLEFYSESIKCINLKLDHFYGPNDNPVKFIAWVIEQFKNNSAEINLTQGTQTRDFIYIDDVVSAFDTVLENESKINSGQLNTFEVGTGTKTSVKEMILTIQKNMNNTTTKLNFGAIPLRKNEITDYQLDTSKLHQLGWMPKYTSPETGVKQLLQTERGL